MLVTEKQIRTRADLREWIGYEVKKYRPKGRIWFRFVFPISEMDVLIKHQVLLRKTEYYVNNSIMFWSLIYRVRLMKFQNKYALHVPINTCGKGLKIMHVGPVLINGRATVGENCSIHINTALVAGGPSDETPTIGNGVAIGVGAVIIGGVHVADNSWIGANAVVTKSVNEPNVAIAGVPARVLHKRQTQ